MTLMCLTTNGHRLGPMYSEPHALQALDAHLMLPQLYTLDQ